MGARASWPLWTRPRVGRSCPTQRAGLHLGARVLSHLLAFCLGSGLARITAPCMCPRQRWPQAARAPLGSKPPPVLG
eukprot:4012401-Alexandrium_andersonii.AAC.1